MKRTPGHPLSVTAVGLAIVAGSIVSAGDARAVTCETPADYPCDFQIGSFKIAKVPPIFKFQSRVSQAKLPIGEGTFNKVFVKVKNPAGTVICLEEFRDITVRNSVLNLEIGHNMSCELEDVIAREPNLLFQICLGSSESCLKAISLAATPLAVKSTFSFMSEKAHRADFAGQAHYAHRVTADRNLLTSSSLGFGYFDFYTHVASDVGQIYPNAADYAPFANSAFMQWTPVQDASAKSVHIVGKDHLTDRLTFLDHFIVFSEHGKFMGDLTVNERGDQDLGILVTGDSVIIGTCPDPTDTSCSPAQLKPSLEVKGQVLMGFDVEQLDGFGDRRTHGLDGDFEVRGDDGNPNAALRVSGQFLFGVDEASLQNLKGDLPADTSTHGIAGDLEIIGDPANMEPALQVTGQVIMGNMLSRLKGYSDGVTHGIDGDLQIVGDPTNPNAGLEVTGRLLAGDNPAALTGASDPTWSGIDGALQITEGLTVDRGGAYVGDGDLVVNNGSLHVFGLQNNEIHGDTEIFGSITLRSNGNLSVPTGRVESLDGLWLSDNLTGFQPAIISADDLSFPMLMINPIRAFVETHFNGTVVFENQVFFRVPPTIETITAAITAGPGILVVDDATAGAPWLNISVDQAYLDNNYQRVDGAQDVQIPGDRMLVFSPPPVSILTVKRASNEVMVTTATAHGFTSQSVVDIDASDDSFDETSILVAFVSTTEFQYTQAGANVFTITDSGTVTDTRTSPAISMVFGTGGSKPALVFNPALAFREIKLHGDSVVVDQVLAVGSRIDMTNQATGLVESAMRARGSDLVLNESAGFANVVVNGNLRVSTGYTVSAPCRTTPTPMTRIGSWCVDIVRRPLTVVSEVGLALADCANEGAALCSAEAMLHCMQTSTGSWCTYDLTASGNPRMTVTSSMLEDPVPGGTVLDRFAIWWNVVGNFLPQETADTILVAPGPLPPPASYYCCTAATPGQ